MYTHEQRMDEIDDEIKKQLIYCLPIIILSISMPVLAFNGVFMPTDETISSWFQRSGSLSVLFAVLTEYRLFKLHGYLYPTGLLTEDAYRFRIKYGLIYSLLTILSAIMALTGTFIWGWRPTYINS